ncbi:hypothetical protein L9F63_005625, partial [Diploptera punctata]
GSSKPGAFLDMKSNTTTGPGRLKLEFNYEVEAYYTSNVDVPNFNSRSVKVPVTNSYHVLLILAVTEVENAEGIKSTPIAKRECKFRTENEGITSYKYYSDTTCESECLKKKMKEVCNCISPQLARVELGDKVCNLSGVICLRQKFGEMTVIVNSWENRTGIVCKCMKNCEEMYIDLVFRETLSQ